MYIRHNQNMIRWFNYRIFIYIIIRTTIIKSIIKIVRVRVLWQLTAFLCHGNGFDLVLQIVAVLVWAAHPKVAVQEKRFQPSPGLHHMHSRETSLSPLPAVSQGGSLIPQFTPKPVPRIKILKRILRESWELGQSNLATLFEGVVSWLMDEDATFQCYLGVPSRHSCCWSLVTMINKQLGEEEDPPLLWNKISFTERRIASQILWRHRNTRCLLSWKISWGIFTWLVLNILWHSQVMPHFGEAYFTSIRDIHTITSGCHLKLPFYLYFWSRDVSGNQVFTK